jgi:hypothetical protein
MALPYSKKKKEGIKRLVDGKQKMPERPEMKRNT